MKRFVSLAAGALVALAALSAPPAYAAVAAPLTLTWTNPTTGCATVNGVVVTPCQSVPLTGADALAAVDVYISTAVIPDDFTGAPTFSVTAPATTSSTTYSLNSGQTMHIRLKARTASGGVSKFTPEVTKTVTAGVEPGVPTSVTVTLNIS